MAALCIPMALIRSSWAQANHVSLLEFLNCPGPLTGGHYVPWLIDLQWSASCGGHPAMVPVCKVTPPSWMFSDRKKSPCQPWWTPTGLCTSYSFNLFQLEIILLHGIKSILNFAKFANESWNQFMNDFIHTLITELLPTRINQNRVWNWVILTKRTWKKNAPLRTVLPSILPKTMY